MIYRILYIDSNQKGHYLDVEGANLGVVIWNTALEVGGGSLVDTMYLPGKDNAYRNPFHAEPGPSLHVEE